MPSKTANLTVSFLVKDFLIIIFLEFHSSSEEKSRMFSTTLLIDSKNEAEFFIITVNLSGCHQNIRMSTISPNQTGMPLHSYYHMASVLLQTIMEFMFLEIFMD